jgi:HK97 family phage major capsid protein
MENTDTNTEIREEIDSLSREIVALREAAPVVSAAPSYNSFGDFVKAVVRGDEQAMEMTRAYAGAVVSPEGPDSIGRDQWVNEALLMVDHGRPSLNAFRRAGLPEAGLNIDYPAVSANTIDAEVQAAQGDTLTFGKLSLETKTTPVKTIGGWTDVSRQTIERSSVAYLSEVFRAMSLAYGKQTNDLFIENLNAGTYTTLTGVAGSAEGVTGAVADASIDIYSNAGARPQFLLASPDVWKTLVTLFAVDGRPIVGGNAPVNNIGVSNLPQMTANLFGLEVIVDPALPAGTLYIANSNAITTWESGGAPYRLSDEDITNLTNQFSIYGYVAYGTIYPEMVVKVEFA